MVQNGQNYEEMEIDLSLYTKVLIKRKRTFIGVFMLVLIAGVGFILFSPKIYRISALLQPPVSGEALSGADDIESAENLKGLIVNGFFNEAMAKRLDLDLNVYPMKFNVKIPNKTNVLEVSIDVEAKDKKFGIEQLQNLINVISETYIKRVKAKIEDIDSKIKFNERAIASFKEKTKNLQDQIKEINVREDKLKEEIKFVNTNTAQILDKREGLLKANTPTENPAILLLANYIQNNSSYLNQVNNQYTELSLRRVNLEFELKKIDTEISNSQMEIDKLRIVKQFISNLRVASSPRASLNPINSNKKTSLALTIFMGLFFGVIAVFLQEFWVNNFKKGIKNA